MHTLIIVDDEPSTRTGLEQYFDWGSHGIQVVDTAENGDSAYNSVLKHQPSIVLTDVRMPILDGIGLARRIRETNRDLPIIFISGHEDVAYMKSAIQMDAVDYILKPINFQELTRVVRKTVDRLEEEDERKKLLAGMNAKLSQSLPLLKEKFFATIIQDGVPPAAALQRQMEFLGIDLPLDGQYCLFVISLDNYAAQFASFSERDKQLLSFALLNMSQEMLERFGGGYAFEHRQGEYVCVLALRNEDDESSLYSLMQELQTAIASLLKLSVTIGVGQSVAGLDQLPLSYAMASDAIDQKLFLGLNQIIKMDSLRPEGMPMFKLSRQQSSAFASSLRAGDEEKALGLLDELFAQMYQRPVTSQRQCQNLCLQLFLIGSNLRMELGLSSASVDQEESNFWERLVRLDTAVDMKLLLGNNLRNLCADIQGKRNNRSRNVIELAKSVIHNRYGDNLTIQQIADEIYLTSTYLCLIFKQETGFTLNEYLTQVRIDKAKELLRDPRIKMYDISYAVGYTVPSYFTKQFKKHTGLTPKEYRDSSV